jgi:hypothetical protein
MYANLPPTLDGQMQKAVSLLEYIASLNGNMQMAVSILGYISSLGEPHVMTAAVATHPCTVDAAYQYP